MPEVSFLREYDAVGNSFPACRENPALETFCEPPTRSLALGICKCNELRMAWIAPLLGATRDAPGMTARLFFTIGATERLSQRRTSGRNWLGTSP